MAGGMRTDAMRWFKDIAPCRICRSCPSLAVPCLRHVPWERKGFAAHRSPGVDLPRSRLGARLGRYAFVEENQPLGPSS
eukprot:7963593-Alexandrium_andersonii.AAC.1